jgi:hypothetical protein
VLALSDGDVGVGYSVVTNETNATCAVAAGETLSRVAFSISTDGGKSFGPPRLVGDRGSSTCPYFQALEPTFALGSSGEVFGVYVGANATRAALIVPPRLGTPGTPVLGYATRPQDALVLIESTDNGSTFSNGSVILAGSNIARPSLAVFGSTLYVVYENIDNSTRHLAGQPFYAIAAMMIVSTDRGAHWSAPSPLPGVNLAPYNAGPLNQFDTSFSPSIAVSPEGVVAAAYATNRTCIALLRNCVGAPGAALWGEDIDAVTSSDNGSRWSPPHQIAQTGEPNVLGYYLVGGSNTTMLFSSGPSTSITWGASSADLFVAWSGAYNLSSPTTTVDYGKAGIFAATSTDGGIQWSVSRIGPEMVDSPTIFWESYFNPVIAYAHGTVYLAYSYRNDSLACGCTGRDIVQQFSEWLTQSPNGMTWANPSLVELDPRSQGLGYESYVGFDASVAFNGSGDPILGYSLPSSYSQFDAGVGYLQGENVTVATEVDGPTLNVTFEAAGLPASTNWTLRVDGQTYASTSQNLTLTGLPAGDPILLEPLMSPVAVGWGEYKSFRAGARMVSLAANTTNLSLNVTTWVGLKLLIEPTNAPYASAELAGPDLDYRWTWQTSPDQGISESLSAGCPYPWYVPLSSPVPIAPSSGNASTLGVQYYAAGSDEVGYWNGTGNGSFTGTGSEANLTLSEPVNETLWLLPDGLSPLRVITSGLPNGTGFGFSLSGTAYLGTAGSALMVPNLRSGVYSVGNITASAAPGWRYFGWSVPSNPVVVPDEPQTELEYSDVDLQAPAGIVSFQESGLATGSSWQVEFNGSRLSSSTPWINVTCRPGDYPVASFPVVSPNGTAAYVASLSSSALSLGPGMVVDVPFAPTYLLDVLASSGGSVSPSTPLEWVAPGQKLNLSAEPDPGFGFAGWAGTGNGSYTGGNPNSTIVVDGPVLESASFFPLVADRFNMTVVESGIPDGTEWTVYVGGVGYSSNVSSLKVPDLYSCTFSGRLGLYSIAVPFAYGNLSTDLSRYVPTAYPASSCGEGTVPVTFQVQYWLTIESSGGGTVQAEYGATSLPPGTSWVPAGSSVTLSALPASGSIFSEWVGTGTGNYSGTTNPLTIPLQGAVVETALFAPFLPTYRVEFVASAVLPAGIPWSVVFGGRTYSSTTSSLYVEGVAAGSYPLEVPPAFDPEGSARYESPLNGSRVTVERDTLVNLTWSVSYWCSIASFGPGLVTPGSAWVAAGATVPLYATPAGGAVFVGWNGTGPEAYSGPAPNVSLSVVGPVTEFALFAPAPSPASSSTPFAEVAAGLAAVAVVGVVIGVLLRRRTGRPPGAPPTGSSPEGGEPDAGPGDGGDGSSDEEAP